MSIIKYATIGLGVGAVLGLAYVGASKFKATEQTKEQDGVIEGKFTEVKPKVDQFAAFRKPVNVKTESSKEVEVEQSVITEEDMVKAEAMNMFFNDLISEEDMNKVEALLRVIEEDEDIEPVIEPTLISIANQPSTLEETLHCFKAAALLEDEGMEIEEQLRFYGDKIRWYKMRKGLNHKAFKAVVKRSGIEPNTVTWTKLFATLKDCEQRAEEEFGLEEA